MRRAALAALLWGAAACAAPPPAAPPRRVAVAVEEAAERAEAPAGRVFSVCDRDALPTIVRLIDGAHERVEIVVFQGTVSPATERIAEAVRRAVARGVRVRATFDDGPKQNVDLARLLTGAGAEAGLDGPGVRTHAKMLVVDRRAALVGSTNWSTHSLTRNHEANVLIENPALAAFLDDYVERVRSGGGRQYREGPSAPEATPVVDDAIGRALAKTIRGARGRLDLIVYAVSERPGGDDFEGPLAEAIAAAGRGVRVRALFERTGQERDAFINDLNRRAAGRLAAAGAEVRWDPPDRVTHAKVVIADGEALVSSANWSVSSLADGHEAGAVVRDAGALGDLRAYFDRLWEEATPD